MRQFIIAISIFDYEFILYRNHRKIYDCAHQYYESEIAVYVPHTVTVGLFKFKDTIKLLHCGDEFIQSDSSNKHCELMSRMASIEK